MQTEKNSEHYSLNYKKYAGGYSGEISDLVPPYSRVLDIGCGTGNLARVLKRKHCGVVGLDIDPNALKEAKKHCSRVIQCNLDNFSEDCKDFKSGSFDVVTMGDLIEHIKYPANLLTGVRPLLRSGGLIIASIPNAAFIQNRTKFLFGNFDYNKNGGLMDYDHLRFFTFKSARELFEETNYKIRLIYGKNTVKNKFWILRPLARIFPTLFAIHIIIVAEKQK